MGLAQQSWVLTGAGGTVAGSMREGLAAQVRQLRLMDRVAIRPVYAGETTVVGDVGDQAALDAAFGGADGVLHLGGIADEADFHDLVEVNIVGTYHVLEAARRAGVPRVVYASSNRLTGYYPRDELVDPSMPPRPDGLYGVSKVAGEALGRLYADKFGLQVVSIRIGSFQTVPRDERQLSTWLSPRDCLSAFLAAMTSAQSGYAAFYAVSDNTARWWDLDAGAALGFVPRDDAEQYRSGIEPGFAEDGPQGGLYATAEYTLERQRPSNQGT